MARYMEYAVCKLYSAEEINSKLEGKILKINRGKTEHLCNMLSITKNVYHR